MSTDYSSIKEINVDGVIKYSRPCPTCGKILYHKGINSAKQQHKKKSNCKECSNKVISEKLSGENAPWYGKKIPREFVDKAKKTKSERVYTYYQNPEYIEKRRKYILENPIMKGKTLYEIWVEKYGEEEANRKMEEYKQNCSNRLKGENNPNYGKKFSPEVVEKMRTARIAAGYENSQTPEFREKMKKISKIKEVLNGKSVYEYWLEKYGKEEADRREFEMNEGQRKNTPRGENSPHFGKPPPKGVGHGWQGWYKDVFFRSLTELMFIIPIVDNNIPYINLEAAEYGILYEINGEKHMYHGDFLVGNNFIEIKPLSKQNNIEVLAKKEAALKYCAEHGYTFKFECPLLDYELIRSKYLNGDIKPQERFVDKFEKCFRLGKGVKRVFQKANSTYRGPNNPVLQLENKELITINTNENKITT